MRKLLIALLLPICAVASAQTSPWSGSAYVDLRHGELSTVVNRELGNQTFIIGKYTLGVNFNAFVGATVWSKNNTPSHGVAGFSADLYKTISKEGARFTFGIAGSSPFTSRPLDFGYGFRLGLSLPIKL